MPKMVNPEGDDTSADLLDDPEFQEWAEGARKHLVPMLQQSAITVSLVPQGPADIKFAVELGLSIMMDKPIIAVVTPGRPVPERLIRVADVIVEGDMSTAKGRRKLQEAIQEAIKRLEKLGLIGVDGG